MNGTCQAIKHLASTGRQNIGLISGPPTTTSSEEKYNGYRLGLALCELPFDPRQVMAADFDADSGRRQTRALLGQHPDLDAIVYAMDDQALGGLLALKESGRRVPDDVAIVGFYDHDVARFTDPPLSSVRIDWPPIGAVAARRLCMMIDSPDDQTCTIVKPTTLVVRESSTAPRQWSESRPAHAAM
jgi:DNA-binding LacI/PurR family transcriptional regulator